MNLWENPYAAPDYVPISQEIPDDSDDSEDREPDACFVSPLEVVIAASRFYFSRRFPVIAVGLFLLFTMMTTVTYQLDVAIGGPPVSLALLPILGLNSLLFVLFIKYYTGMIRGRRSEFSPERVLIQTFCVIAYVIGGSILTLIAGTVLGYILIMILGPMGLVDYSTGFGVLGLCYLFVGGCLAPGGWLIVEYRMDPFSALSHTRRILLMNLPVLFLFFLWTLAIAGGAIVTMDRAGVLYDYRCHLVWFFVAPFLMLHYPAFCMLAVGEKIKFSPAS